MRVRFGDCVFDTESHRLARAGQPVELTPKAFELLALLLELRPRVVSRAELHDTLWPASFVGRTSLPRLVSEVRRAIGDSAAEANLVRTVCSVGYAFAGAAWPVDEAGEAEGVVPAKWSRLQLVIASGPLVSEGLESRLGGAWIAVKLLLADGEEVEIEPAPLRLGQAAASAGLRR